MKNIKNFIHFSFTLITLIIIACSEELPDPDVSNRDKDQVLNEAHDFNKVSFARSFTGRDSLQGIAFMSKGSGNYLNSNSGLSSNVVLEGSGKATHMAQINVIRNHSIINKTLIAEGEIKYLSAKGDELSGSYEGDQVLENNNGTINFRLREEITEGTGRFEGVVGVINTTGTLNPDGTFTYNSVGWLSNNKSNKQKTK
jgi:hypothetical protein